MRKPAANRDDGRMNEAAELLSPAGEELLALLGGLDVTPEVALRLGDQLRRQYPAGLVAAALTQQSLRIAGREKFSRADEMFFTRAGLEQASAEVVAAHSALRFANTTGRVADLCCGIGGDLIALAAASRGSVPGGDADGRGAAQGHGDWVTPAASDASARVVAVDADPDVLEFAVRNLAVYGHGGVSAVCADVHDLDLTGIEAIFIDPARRTGRRRLRTGDSEPPLDWCFTLADRVPRVCIKAAPGVAHELVPADWEMEFVATGRALKEALLWSAEFATTTRRATVLTSGAGSGEGQDEGDGLAATVATLVAGDGPSLLVSEPGEFLLDPNPAVTRAGLVAELGREVGGWQIDPMIAFLSLDRPVRTPFARTLRVIASLPWHERDVSRTLRELGVGSADIRRRGLAGDVEQIRRRLRLEGDRSAVIALTRRDDRPWCLICEPVPG
jgi:predicted RNA methylase